MRLCNLRKVALLGLLTLPLLGGTCTEEKTVEFVVTGQSIATFHAQGTTNVDLDLGTAFVDFEEDIDLRQIALDYDVNPDSIRSVTFRGLHVKIETADAEPSREVTGTLFGAFGGAPEIAVGSVTGFPAGAETDWIDITTSVTSGGVDEINATLAELLAAAQEDRPPVGVAVDYRWDGSSAPPDVRTDFWWAVKVVLNIVPTVTGEFPDF